MVERDIYNPELEQTALKNRNMIGSIFERKEFPQLRRQIKLNGQKTYEEKKDFMISYEILRYLGIVDLSMTLKNEIFYNYWKYEACFPKGSRERGISLIPVVIYIVCLKRLIFINKRTLIRISHRTRKDFHKTLKEILQYDNSLQKLIASDEFRTKYILNVFIGIANHFNFPPGSIKYIENGFQAFYNKYKNLSNMNIIVGLYLFISHTYAGLRHVADIHIARFLGVHQAMFTKMKRRLN